VCQSDVSLWSTKMSKTDTMARLPGLFQRAGVWTLCMKIPLDPSGGLPGALEDHRVLQTTDHGEAKVK